VLEGPAEAENGCPTLLEATLNEGFSLLSDVGRVDYLLP